MMPEVSTFSEGSRGSKIMAEIMEDPKRGCEFYPELLISFDQDINAWKRNWAWNKIIKKSQYYYLDSAFLDAFDLYSAVAEAVAGIGKVCEVHTQKCNACTNDIVGLGIDDGKACYCSDDINPFNNEIIPSDEINKDTFNAPNEVWERFNREAPLTKGKLSIINYMLSGIPDVSLEEIDKSIEEYGELPKKEQLLY